MLQIEFETELSKYQGDLEGIKSKNNVSSFYNFGHHGGVWVEQWAFISHENYCFILSWIEIFNHEYFQFQDLRSKNRKAIDALSDLEHKYVKILKEKS